MLTLGKKALVRSVSLLHSVLAMHFQITKGKREEARQGRKEKNGPREERTEGKRKERAGNKEEVQSKLFAL